MLKHNLPGRLPRSNRLAIFVIFVRRAPARRARASYACGFNGLPLIRTHILNAC